MRKTIGSMIGAVLMMMLSVTLTFAWPGGPPAKVLIKGPGIAGEVEVIDQAMLDGLGAEQFIDWSQSSTVQPFVTDGYELVRYYKDGSHTWALDRVRYYPNPKGGRGAILYVGGVDVNTGGGVWNGKWFNATPEGDAGMARLLKHVTSASVGSVGASSESKSATVKNSNLPSTNPTVTAKDDDTPSLLMVIAGIVGLLAVVSAFGFWLGRRARTQ